MREQHDQLLDHEYDGIREYDNPTPGWWHGIFFVTLLFGLVYGLIWELNPGAPTIQTILAADQVGEFKRMFADLGPLEADEPTVLRMMQDTKWMAIGESVFKANCVTCHGASGQGLVGPNLTDDRYKNIKTIADLPRVISTGAAGGAMPSWKGRLQQNEIVLVASYVASLRGKNLSGPRPAEGDPIPPWPSPPPPPATPAAKPGAQASVSH